MAMILFLILHKLKFYLKSHSNPSKVVLTIFLIITAWIYGRLIGEFMNKLAIGEIDFFTPERFLSYVLAAILMITMIRMVFPDYRALKQIFPRYYPISNIQKYAASILNDFVTPYFFYLSFFILTCNFYSSDQGFDFLYPGFLVMIGSHLLRRCIQYLLDFRLSITGKISSVLFVFVLYINIDLLELKLSDNLYLLVLICFLFLIGFIQEYAIIEGRSNEFTSKSLKSNIAFKMLINNKKARLTLMIGLLLKASILLGDFLFFKTKGKHFFDGQLIFWLFASPLIIFTYVFNNAWGFWKNIWLNFDLRSGDYKLMIRQSFSLMLAPLLIDVIFTLPILLISWNNPVFILLFYLTTACYLIMLSFLWSLITPKKIASIFQMNGSTSPVSIITTIGGVILLTTMKINQLFYILIPLFLIIGGIAFWISINIYKNKKYLITNKLMKE
jgi:hypothetical protein